MKLTDIKPGIRVRITKGHGSGHGGRVGKVVAIGTFEGGPSRIGVMVDIGEPLLTIIEPEALEDAPEDPLPPGWGEFEL